MKYSAHYQRSEVSPSTYRTTRRSPLGKPSQAFASLTNIDMRHKVTAANKYIHPSSNNPTFFSAPELNACSPSSHLYTLDNSAYSLPFPIPPCQRLLTEDLDIQPASDFGTPSSMSSSYSHMAITPLSPPDEGQTVVTVETVENINGEDRPMSRDIEFDGETDEYVMPHGFPPFTAALESDSGMEASFYPRHSAATSCLTHSAWQFENAMCDAGAAWLRAAIQPSADYVSYTQDVRVFPKHTRQQRRAHIYPKHGSTYTSPVRTVTPAYTPAPLSSGRSSSPPTSPSHFSSQSSPPLSLTSSRFTCQTIPLHQPQPIRPIPIIPLSDISSSVSGDFSMSSHGSSPYLVKAHADTDAETTDSHSSVDLLSPFSLLCQPVSDAVRYQALSESVTGTLSPTSTSGDQGYSNNLPKVFGGFFCVCGCLGLKHSDAEGWSQS